MSSEVASAGSPAGSASIEPPDTRATTKADWIDNAYILQLKNRPYGPTHRVTVPKDLQITSEELKQLIIVAFQSSGSVTAEAMKLQSEVIAGLYWVDDYEKTHLLPLSAVLKKLDFFDTHGPGANHKVLYLRNPDNQAVENLTSFVDYMSGFSMLLSLMMMYVYGLPAALKRIAVFVIGISGLGGMLSYGGKALPEKMAELREKTSGIFSAPIMEALEKSNLGRILVMAMTCLFMWGTGAGNRLLHPVYSKLNMDLDSTIRSFFRHIWLSLPQDFDLNRPSHISHICLKVFPSLGIGESNLQLCRDLFLAREASIISVIKNVLLALSFYLTLVYVILRKSPTSLRSVRGEVGSATKRLWWRTPLLLGLLLLVLGFYYSASLNLRRMLWF